MATLLSQAQALIEYANGVTGKTDTTLGDAVKSLADNYGGTSGTEFPNITDSSLLSSQVQALITYANSIDGQADTKLGDAMRHLADSTPAWMKEASETYGIPLQNLKNAQSQSDYTFVSSIYGSNSKYIDTGYIPTSTTGFMLAASNLSPITADVNFVGCRISGGARFILNIYNMKYLTYGYNAWVYSKQQTLNMTTDFVNKVTLNYKNERLVRYNDTSVAITETFAAIGFSIYVGAQNSSGSTTDSRCSYDIHMFTITEGTDCKQFLLPCIRKSDAKTGMYDLISGKFFTNKGTGEFAYGEEVTLQSKFEELDS